MIKKELVEKVAATCKIDKDLVDIMLDTTLRVIQKTVAEGDDVVLRSFGTFSKVKRKSKIGQNIHTGESVIIPDRYVPRFKPNTHFRTITNKE